MRRQSKPQFHPSVLGKELAIGRHQLFRLGLADIANVRRERKYLQHHRQPGGHQPPEQAVQREQLFRPLQHARPQRLERGPARTQESRERHGDWSQKWLKRLMGKR